MEQLDKSLLRFIVRQVSGSTERENLKQIISNNKHLHKINDIVSEPEKLTEHPNFEEAKRMWTESLPYFVLTTTLVYKPLQYKDVTKDSDFSVLKEFTDRIYEGYKNTLMSVEYSGLIYIEVPLNLATITRSILSGYMVYKNYKETSIPILDKEIYSRIEEMLIKFREDMLLPNTENGGDDVVLSDLYNNYMKIIHKAIGFIYNGIVSTISNLTNTPYDIVRQFNVMLSINEFEIDRFANIVLLETLLCVVEDKVDKYGNSLQAYGYKIIKESGGSTIPTLKFVLDKRQVDFIINSKIDYQAVEYPVDSYEKIGAFLLDIDIEEDAENNEQDIRGFEGMLIDILTNYDLTFDKVAAKYITTRNEEQSNGENLFNCFQFDHESSVLPMTSLRLEDTTKGSIYLEDNTHVVPVFNTLIQERKFDQRDPLHGYIIATADMLFFKVNTVTKFREFLLEYYKNNQGVSEFPITPSYINTAIVLSWSNWVDIVFESLKFKDCFVFKEWDKLRTFACRGAGVPLIVGTYDPDHPELMSLGLEVYHRYLGYEKESIFNFITQFEQTQYKENDKPYVEDLLLGKIPGRSKQIEFEKLIDDLRRIHLHAIMTTLVPF